MDDKDKVVIVNCKGSKELSSYYSNAITIACSDHAMSYIGWWTIAEVTLTPYFAIASNYYHIIAFVDLKQYLYPLRGGCNHKSIKHTAIDIAIIILNFYQQCIAMTGYSYLAIEIHMH